MTLLDFVNILLALGVIGLQFFVVVAVIYVLSTYKNERVDSFFGKNGLILAFIVALLATIGSLFYSNYAGFVPCQLCWFQRIFMYPQVLFLGLVLMKKPNMIKGGVGERVINYSLLFAVIGGVISVYHNYIYFKGIHATVCTSAESCITPYVTEFGYITIPVMALTVFATIIILLTLWKKQKEKKEE